MFSLILSLLGVAGVGGAAVAFPPFGALLLGLGRGALAFLEKLPWYVYVAAALIGLIAFMTISRGRFMDRAHADEVRIAQFCQTVRMADHNSKLDCSKTEAQVQLMGESLTNVTNALNRQTAAVNELGRKAAQQQKIATEAEKRATQRADQAEAVAQRLAASSRSVAKSASACAPSAALQEQWP